MVKHLILTVVIVACGIFYACEKPKPKLPDNTKPLTPKIPIIQKKLI